MLDPRSQTVSLSTRTEGDVLVLQLGNKQLHGNRITSQLKKELLGAVPDKSVKPKVVLDLSSVESLTSEIFRPFISLRRRVDELEGELVLCNLSDNVKQTFQATRLMGSQRSSNSTFNVQPNLETAVASFE